jgi:hypothetical protein
MVALALAAPALAVEQREPAARVAAALATLHPGPRVADGTSGRVYVVVATFGAVERAALTAAGLAIEVPVPGTPAPPWRGGVVVQGVADVAARAAIGALPFVRRLEEPGARWADVGAVTSAGDAIVRGPEARAALATDGSGVTVGVISDGIDHRDAVVASGDLSPDVTVAPGLSAGRGDEGTAMLEIVHDVAPGARLLFAGPTTSAEMVAAVDGLAAAGAQVIIDDLIFTDEPKFEDGPIALAAHRFVAAGGVYVTSAGNFARLHYYASYRRTPTDSLAAQGYRALHAFGADDFGETLRVPPGGSLLAVLQWSEPFGHAAANLDLILARTTGHGDVVLGASTTVQDGRGDPIEAVTFENDGGDPAEVYLAIGQRGRIAAPGRLRLNLVVFTHADVELEHVVRREGVFGHAAAVDVLSVAAADATHPDMVDGFSSGGPAMVFFPQRSVRRVPRLTGIDGVETVVGRAGLFANPFRGTSAAGPHVAGCAAVLLAGGMPAGRVDGAMTAHAVDLGDPGFDAIAGAGRLDCAAAVSGSDAAPGTPVVTSLRAAFDPSGAVTVAVEGGDADGNVRALRLVLGDGRGRTVAARVRRIRTTAGIFRAEVRLRGARLARVRAASVRVRDATGLGAEASAAVACPGDGSLGDAVCAVGEIETRLDDAARTGVLRRTARAAARWLVRAGAHGAAGQAAAEHLAVRAASRQLARLAARAARAPLASELRQAVVDGALALRAQLGA